MFELDGVEMRKKLRLEVKLERDGTQIEIVSFMQYANNYDPKKVWIR